MTFWHLKCQKKSNCQFWTCQFDVKLRTYTTCCASQLTGFIFYLFSLKYSSVKDVNDLKDTMRLNAFLPICICFYTGLFFPPSLLPLHNLLFPHSQKNCIWRKKEKKFRANSPKRLAMKMKLKSSLMESKSCFRCLSFVMTSENNV